MVTERDWAKTTAREDEGKARFSYFWFVSTPMIGRGLFLLSCFYIVAGTQTQKGKGASKG